jgi:hypothetical protein
MSRATPDANGKEPMPSLADDSIVGFASEPRSAIPAKAGIAARAGRIDWIDPKGKVRGWAVAEGEWPLAVEVRAGARQLCTALADRCYPAPAPAGERSGLVGFTGWIPPDEMQRNLAPERVVLRCLRTGAELFAAPAASLMIGRAMTVPGRLPTDAVAAHPFGAIYDRALVEQFYRNYGPELFTELAYCYVLERLADPLGAAGIVGRLRSGEIGPRDVLWDMYNSEERRGAGPFLGPRASDPDYPFAADPGGSRRPAAADPPAFRPTFHAASTVLPVPEAAARPRQTAPSRRLRAAVGAKGQTDRRTEDEKSGYAVRPPLAPTGGNSGR